MATIGSAKATLVNKIDSLTSSATAKDTIFLAKALKENTTHHSFTYQGAWAANTDYALDDVVTNGGNTYINKLAYTSGSSFSTGSNWDMMAEAGTNGTNGASGFPSGGTVGQVVTNTGSGTGGWADAGSGHLVSFHNDFDTATYSTTSTTYDSHGHSCSITITPASTSSKFLLLFTGNIGNNTSARRTSFKFYKNGSPLNNSLTTFEIAGATSIEMPGANSYYDSPNTTSAVTYDFKFISNGSGDTAYIRYSQLSIWEFAS